MIVKRNLKIISMIPILIFYALRKFKTSQTESKRVLKLKKLIKKVIVILSLLTFTSNYCSNPSAPTEFTILTKKTFQKISKEINKNNLNHCGYNISIIN